jgi:hypothetical protein
MSRIPPPTLLEYIADQRSFASMVGAALVRIEVPDTIVAAARRDAATLDIEFVEGRHATYLAPGDGDAIPLSAGPEYRALFRYPDGSERWGGYVVSED